MEPTPGPTTVLSSGRLGRLIAHNASDEAIFIGEDGRPLCRHGEKASSILNWASRERSEDAKWADFERDSVCDCSGILGLLTNYIDGETPEYNVSKDDLPKFNGKRSSLYEFLGGAAAEECRVRNVPQRFVSKIPVSGHGIWMQPSGMLVCKHGNSAKVLRKMNPPNPATAQVKPYTCDRRDRCTCRLDIPRRCGGRLLPPNAKRRRVESANEDEVVGVEEDLKT